MVQTQNSIILVALMMVIAVGGRVGIFALSYRADYESML